MLDWHEVLTRQFDSPTTAVQVPDWCPMISLQLLCDTAVCFLHAHEIGTHGWSNPQQSPPLERFCLSLFVCGHSLSLIAFTRGLGLRINNLVCTHVVVQIFLKLGASKTLSLSPLDEFLGLLHRQKFPLENCSEDSFLVVDLR